MSLNKSSLVIGPNQPDSHQAKPSCIVKFISFRDKDSFYLSDSTNSSINSHKKTFNKDAFESYTIVSDIITVSINSSKSSPMITGEILLSSGDLNYISILAPGDHCMVWMLNDETKYDSLSVRVYKDQKANEFNSGLKFIGRVNSIRAIYGISPNGIKTLRYLVTLKGFSEFQSMMYYNPLLYQPGERGGTGDAANGIETQLSGLRFFARISDSWRSLINGKGAAGLTPNDLLPFFINLFLGVGAKNASNEIEKITESPDAAFLIPSAVAQLLGKKSGSSKNVKYIDILKSFVGVQKYGSNAIILPTNLSDTIVNSINTCRDDLTGAYLSLPDTFSGHSIWQILSNHLNGYINEMYVSIRVGNDNGDIFPVYTARQIPFTSQKYAKQKSGKTSNDPKAIDLPAANKFTLFAELPRWKIDIKYPINSYNFGTSDALRFNFIQVFGAMIGYENQDASVIQQAQIEKKNYTIDDVDISRNGVKMQVLQTNVDIVKNSNLYDLSSWASLIGDFFHNGHLKLNGTISLPGVQQPISIGDNLEFDGNLFHIENINHMYQVDETSGMKMFATNLQLSNGVSADSMDNYITLHQQRRENLPDKTAPGYSDTEIYIGNTPIISPLRNK